MLRLLILFCFIICFSCKQKTSTADIKRYKVQAENVTIIRDEWGVPHIYGKTDAEAVFGLMYAQCEESFERVERAYIKRMGRMAEVDGENFLIEDIKARQVYDTAAAIADYHKSPDWLKKLLNAFADGVNYYLYKHPDVEPLLLKKFESWFPLLFTDGAYISFQTGGLLPTDVQELYLKNSSTSFVETKEELTGSNAFAIAPSRSETGKALLYINPHVSFYFRTEMHIVSEEGLNAYGAVTWGNFFVYQGFNENCGWMHTSSMADGADLYEERVVQKDGRWFYEYDGQLKPVTEKKQNFSYRRSYQQEPVELITYYTHHGPVMGSRNRKWLSLKANNRSMEGLIQSWQRTKATNIESFKQTLSLRANPSTNTMYADRQGNIAYWHGNFVPKRNTVYDWSSPVDGSTPATEWQGVHEIDELVNYVNPSSGWLQNCNSSPLYATEESAAKNSYAAYLIPDGENFRSLYARQQLQNTKAFSTDKLTALGYSHYLAAFDSLFPPLFKAYDALKPTDSLKEALAQPIALLKSWDKRSSVSSTATTLAVFWAFELLGNPGAGTEEETSGQAALYTRIAKTTSSSKQLELLNTIVAALERTFGNWQIAWGELNRYQRRSGNVYQQFSDEDASIPVGIASSALGSLPSFETTWRNTRRGYGHAGNSFVAVVEFGDKIKAKTIVTSGQSFDKDSKHFSDQAQMFVDGKFKEAWFYKEDVLKHAVKTYKPGKE
jgi:acyl-homoserine-lactone acylase